MDGGKWVEIVFAKAERQVLHSSIATMKDGAWNCEAAFVLETEALDLECRVWVEKGSDLSVDGIELRPESEYDQAATESAGETTDTVSENSSDG